MREEEDFFSLSFLPPPLSFLFAALDMREDGG